MDACDIQRYLIAAVLFFGIFMVILTLRDMSLRKD
jgi:hypothetical protein